MSSRSEQICCHPPETVSWRGHSKEGSPYIPLFCFVFFVCVYSLTFTAACGRRLFAFLQIKMSAVQREKDDEEEASSPLTCEECGRCDRGHQLLMCTQCDSGYNVALVHFDLFLFLCVPFTYMQLGSTQLLYCCWLIRTTQRTAIVFFIPGITWTAWHCD